MSKFNYINAIKLLGTYSKKQPYYSVGCEAAERFFSGAWNRKNLDAVEAVLNIHDPYGLNEGKFNDFVNPQSEESKITELLSDLKAWLISHSANPINPHGALSACIDKIQAESNLNIINVYEINKMIKMKNPVHVERNDDLAGKNDFTYTDAILLLGQYSGNQPYYSKGSEGFARFFSGAWNRKNVDAVESVLKIHDPYGLHEGKFNDYLNPQSEENKITELLNDLKTKLISEGKEINSEGALAKVINQIQGLGKTRIIDIDDLNAEIKGNTFINR